MAIMNQVRELEDGTVTIPLFEPSTVDNLFRPTLMAPEKVGFEVSYRREAGESMGGDYRLVILVGDRRVETTEPNDVVFATWYPRGGKGWAEELAHTGNNYSESVLKVLGNPDYLQTAKKDTPAYNELMKGFKTDSMSASPLGPV
jgi:hypothetical protein|nr:MAG TPA: hypothetical protein [Caudoviricetes sp.]